MFTYLLTVQIYSPFPLWTHPTFSSIYCILHIFYLFLWPPVLLSLGLNATSTSIYLFICTPPFLFPSLYRNTHNFLLSLCKCTFFFAPCTSFLLHPLLPFFFLFFFFTWFHFTHPFFHNRATPHPKFHHLAIIVTSTAIFFLSFFFGGHYFT